MQNKPTFQDNQFLEQIKNTVLKTDNKAKIYLFGSQARKTANENSDWDFLILTHSALHTALKQQLRNELFEIELDFEVVISNLIYSQQEWEQIKVASLYKNIEKEGIIL